MRKLLLTCCLIVLLASPVAFGQGRPGMGGFGAGMLLANKSVQDELKLTDAQKEKLTAIQKDQREAFQKAFKDMDREAFTKITEDTTKAMNKVKDDLTAAQKKRLAQIEVQVTGLQAFQKEDVQKALNLSEKQLEEVKEIGEEIRKDSGEILKEAGRDMEKRAEAMKKVTKMRTDALAKFAKGLSEEQQKAWKDLTGEAFELKMDAGGFGFPGGPGGKGGKGGKGKTPEKKDA